MGGRRGKVNKPVFKTFSVFNATQSLPGWWKSKAFYNYLTHSIETPDKSQFDDKSKYYSTIFHEWCVLKSVLAILHLFDDLMPEHYKDDSQREILHFACRFNYLIFLVTNLRQSRRLEKCDPLKAGKLLAASKVAYGYRA